MPHPRGGNGRRFGRSIRNYGYTVPRHMVVLTPVARTACGLEVAAYPGVGVDTRTSPLKTADCGKRTVCGVPGKQASKEPRLLASVELS